MADLAADEVAQHRAQQRAELAADDILKDASGDVQWHDCPQKRSTTGHDTQRGVTAKWGHGVPEIVLFFLIADVIAVAGCGPRHFRRRQRVDVMTPTVIEEMPIESGPVIAR
jgi:hypothetical protein